MLQTRKGTLSKLFYKSKLEHDHTCSTKYNNITEAASISRITKPAAAA